jgi:hypothetical protein
MVPGTPGTGLRLLVVNWRRGRPPRCGAGEPSACAGVCVGGHACGHLTRPGCSNGLDGWHPLSASVGGGMPDRRVATLFLA